MTRDRLLSTLGICDNLFGDLNDQEVRYCHWKSNEHLSEGLTGTTDLDVIAERDPALDEILRRNGFKRFETSSQVRFPGMMDYLGFDHETGRLVHLHLHYRLVIGQKRLKNYDLPWVDTLLTRRVFDDEHGIYIADPDMEMVLLLLRYALKIQLRDYAKSIFADYLSSSVTREFNWLRERVDEEDVSRLAADLVNDDAAKIVESMLESRPGIRQFRKLRKVVTAELSPYTTYGYFETKVRGFLREVFLGLRSINNRYLNRPRLYRRTVPRGGVQIALLGVDGAGKSSTAETLADWLSWKIDVQLVYYGSGDGPATLLRYPFIFARRFVDDPGSSKKRSNNEVMSDRSLILQFGRLLRGTVLARERKKKLQKGWRARSRGLVVLGDRYPQNQIMGFNDGPILANHSDSSSRILRYLARKERTVYRDAEQNPPDLVVKLDVSPEIARKRKPDMPTEQLERRADAIRSLKFDTDVHVIDAEQPIEDVVLEVKRAVWETL